MSRAGLYEHSDRGRLLIPEACIRKSLGTLPATKGRIIVGHQPVDWLAEYSCDDVRRILEREATLYLHGHMHEPIAATVRSTIGGALSNQSGALYTGRSRYNGYAVIRLEPQRGMAEVNLRSFYERREVFDQAIDIIDDGRWYSSDEAEAYFAEAHPGFDARSVLRWMSERLSSELRETLDEGFSDRPVSEVFVAPRLAKDSPQSVVADDGPYEDDAQQCALSDLVSGSDNYIVVGKREFGKTTLLRQVALQMVQASIELGRPIVPCLIDFSDIRPGKNRLHRLLRTQLPDMDGYGFGFADLLSRGFLVVLIDDFHFSDAKRRQIVEEFISTHPRCRYILTSKAEILDDLGVNATLDAGTPFIRLSMEPFSRREMRRLVERWDTRGNLDTEAVLDRMVSNIVHINVPLTAVNGTILLTIYEAHGDFVPINKAVLVQTFIETLLDKHSLHQARRERFDFRNQAYVLAYLADHMATSDRYRIVWDEAIEVAHGYFRMMGLPDRASLELRNFIACKILDEKQGEVRFRYRAFLEYFLAARMVEEQPFRKWVF